MVGPSEDPTALLAQAHVVLLRPRWARNLGSVARAMKNFGLSRLTLVESQIGSWNDAWQMAVHAGDVLEASVQADDLEQALADAAWVVGTTNNPPGSVQVLTPREVAEEAARRGPPTLLFGGEINGLDPAELLRCHAVSVVPTAPEQSCPLGCLVFVPSLVSRRARYRFVNIEPRCVGLLLFGDSKYHLLNDPLKLWVVLLVMTGRC